MIALEVLCSVYFVTRYFETVVRNLDFFCCTCNNKLELFGLCKYVVNGKIGVMMRKTIVNFGLLFKIVFLLLLLQISLGFFGALYFFLEKSWNCAEGLSHGHLVSYGNSSSTSRKTSQQS